MNQDEWDGLFIKQSRDKLKNCAISEDIKYFLVNVGLPNADIYFLDLNVEDCGKTVHFEENDYTVIGLNFYPHICIKNTTGEVCVIDQECHSCRTINSSLPQFLAFLKIYWERREALELANDEEASIIVNEMRAAYRRIDEAVMLDEEGWWPAILEETEEGLG